MLHSDVSPDFVYSRLDAEIIAKVVRHEGTPRAIRAFNNEHRKLGDYAYWFLLGTLWVSYSGWSDLALWRRLFSSTRPNRDTSLMKPGELEAWRGLPETFLVFRAHRPDEADWIAYTLAPITAARFARERGVDEVAEYAMAKSDALCLFMRRGESEILALEPSKAQRVRSLRVAPIW